MQEVTEGKKFQKIGVKIIIQNQTMSVVIASSFHYVYYMPPFGVLINAILFIKSRRVR